MHTEQKRRIDIIFKIIQKTPLHFSWGREKILYVSWRIEDSIYKILDCKSAFLMAATPCQASIDRAFWKQKAMYVL